MKRISLLLIIMSLFILTAGCGATDSRDNNSNSFSNVDFGKEDYKKIVPSSNQLGVDLLQIIEADDNGNTFISPISLFIALSMVYNGADGETKAEIANVLKAEGIDVDEMNQANASLMSNLERDSEEIQLTIGNSIWLNEKYQFQDQFAQDNQDYFNAEIQEIDILDSTSADTINDWVSNSTDNKIEEIVKNPLNDKLVALLINAIYFKGSWQFEFDKNQTEERTFYLEDNTTREVQSMTLETELDYLENEFFQAVSLPYGEGEMSMNVFLPKENYTLQEFKTMLTVEQLIKWNSEFHRQQVNLSLPKFQLEYEVILNETLEKLGMPSAFNSEVANFTNMTKEGKHIFISKVKQKTFIDVNEEGTEAAAVTSVETAEESAPASQYMEVNRPFFITITDEKTEAILFMGSISNP